MMVNSLKKFIFSSEFLLLVAVILVSGLAHGINMFHYPYYEDDEGTYMSQAFSFVTQGKLAPYTYVYDHAPGGWLLISLWTLLSGGFFTFGFSVNSGRVLMLFLHLSSSVLLYLVVRRLTQKPLIAALAVIIFSFSPLGIYFQRRVLLDNIMVFWFFVAFTLALYARNRLKTLFVSGLALGLAIITKENAIYFIPVFWYLVIAQNSESKIKSVLTWTIALIVPIIAYILYAFSRGELFPYGYFMGGASPHVSLIGTWLDQLSRSDPGSFSQSLMSWYLADPVLLSLGIISIFFNIYFGLTNFPNRLAALFGIVFILFLARGGITLEFYVIPLIPLLGLNIALSLWCLNSILPKHIANLSHISLVKASTFFLTLSIMIFDLLYFGNHSKIRYSLFRSNQTASQQAAINWMLTQNLPQAVYAIDNYGYVDLHSNQDDHFKSADYYWKIDKDPAISQGILHNDWHQLTHIALTPQMHTDITNPANGLALTYAAWKNSSIIKRFDSDGWSVVISQVQ